MIEINLLKPKIKSNGPRGRRRNALCGLTISAITLTILLCWYFSLKNNLERTRTLQSRLREETVELDRIGRLIAQNQTKLREFDGKSACLEKLGRNRDTPLQVLDTVTSCFPTEQRLSLTRLSHQKQRVYLSGTSLDLEAATDMLMCLGASSLFESVNLNRWERQIGIFYFEISCALKE